MQYVPCFSCFLLVCMFAFAMSTDPIQGCSESLDEGLGEKREARVFFEKNRGLCIPFFYKGEGGNSNNFDSMRSCIIACRPDEAHNYPEGDEVCSLPRDNGPCMAMLLKYYYDTEEKTCRLFHYGGCQGNGNRFNSREECLATCRAKSGRSLGSPDINPDETTVSAGLVVGVLGGVVFGVAVIAAIALFVIQKKGKGKGKKVPTSDQEANEMR